MLQNSAARLPYQKNVLEALAALVVATIVEASNVEMRDIGQGVQIHDFDVIDHSGSTRPFEVTTAMDQTQIQGLAATEQFRTELSALVGDWTLYVLLSPGARITRIANGLPAVLADLHAAGTNSFDTESQETASVLGKRFADLGISRTHGLYSPGTGGVLM